MTTTQPAHGTRADWTTFCAINANRRAVRDFDGSAIPDDDVRAVLEQAMLAPSSGNIQPYQLHWVRDPAQKMVIAAACQGQRAARSAATLVVVVASVGAGLSTVDAQLAYIEGASTLDDTSKAYHRTQLQKFRRFLRVAPLALWAPLQSLISTICPAFSLLPFGPTGARHWTARSAIYAAQTVLLAASARGLDGCPMEGFNARTVARSLGLPRRAVIPVVIALGRRRPDARIEPRWRRAFADAVIVH